MSCTPAVTRCDGPSCEATHEEGQYRLAEGWLQLNGGLGQPDFCGLRCLAEWLDAKLSDPTGNAPTADEPSRAELEQLLRERDAEIADLQAKLDVHEPPLIPRKHG